VARRYRVMSYLTTLAAIVTVAVCTAHDGGYSTFHSFFGGLGMSSVATKRAEFRDQYEVFSLAFSRDGTKLATSSPNSDEVHIWDWRGDPRIVQTLSQGDGAGGSMNGLRYNPNGDLLASAHGAGQESQIVRIWESGTGAVAGNIADHHSGASPLIYAGLEFSSDGRFLMRAQSGGWYMEGSTKVIVDSFIVHDATTWRPVWAMNTEPVVVSTFGASIDGHYAVIAGQERLERNGIPYLQPRILIVDLAERRVRHSSNVLADFFEVLFVVWSPDGRHFAVGGSPVTAGARLATAAVEIFDVKTGKQLAEYTRANASHVRALMYSPDGKYLMIGWDGGVEIWDAQHTKLLQSIAGDVDAASLSHDGRHLAISTGNHEIGVWEIN
jgi:WD40 repeat protein